MFCVVIGNCPGQVIFITGHCLFKFHTKLYTMEHNSNSLIVNTIRNTKIIHDMFIGIFLTYYWARTISRLYVICFSI